MKKESLIKNAITGMDERLLPLNEHEIEKRIYFFLKSRATHPKQWPSGLFKRKIKTSRLEQDWPDLVS